MEVPVYLGENKMLWFHLILHYVELCCVVLCCIVLNSVALYYIVW
jgi:hypothetical protein